MFNISRLMSRPPVVARVVSTSLSARQTAKLWVNIGCLDVVAQREGEQDLRKIRAIINEILEDKLAAVPPTETRNPEELRTEVASCVALALTPEGKSEATQKLQYIRNGHPASLVVHIARDATRSVCGWEYAKSPWHELMSGDAVKHRRCNACRNAL